jgi:hypothetical protein
MKYRTDVIYAVPDMDWLIGRAAWDYEYFHSPDGVERVYYSSLEEAKEKTNLQEVIYPEGEPA